MPSRRITTLTLIGAIVIAGVVGYLVVPTAFNQNKPTSVKVGETFASTSTAYLQAGIQNGYFAKYGLNVSTVRFSSETLMVAALLKGDVQLAIGTAADVMFFDAAGGNARIIATYTQREVFSIVAPVNLTSARSLVGRVATVSTTAGTDYLAIALYLNASGVSPSSMQYIPGGFSAPARLGMVEKGEAQVVAIIPDYLSLLKGTDLHVMVNATAFPEHVAWSNFYGLEPYLTANRNTIDAFMKGLNETHAWFTTNRAGASEVINSYLKSGNITQAGLIWDDWQPAWSSSLRPDLTGVKNMRSLFLYFNPTLSNVSPSGVLDTSYYNDTIR